MGKVTKVYLCSTKSSVKRSVKLVEYEWY